MGLIKPGIRLPLLPLDPGLRPGLESALEKLGLDPRHGTNIRMLIKPIRALLLLCAAATLASAAGSRKNRRNMSPAEEVPRLQVPADLDEPNYPRPLVISAPAMRIPTGDELNPGPPRVVNTAGRGDANAFMAWSAAGAYLKVLDSRESVSRRLGFAIERSGMRMLERGEKAPTASSIFISGLMTAASGRK